MRRRDHGGDSPRGAGARAEGATQAGHLPGAGRRRIAVAPATWRTALQAGGRSQSNERDVVARVIEPGFDRHDRPIAEKTAYRR